LIGEPRRYSDLRAELPGIATNLLAGRLRSLEEAALVARTELPSCRVEIDGRAFEFAVNRGELQAARDSFAVTVNATSVDLIAARLGARNTVERELCVSARRMMRLV
jgi:hypothetical protein